MFFLLSDISLNGCTLKQIKTDFAFINKWLPNFPKKKMIGFYNARPQFRINLHISKSNYIFYKIHSQFSVHSALQNT